MKYISSTDLTLGVEIELQLINPETGGLISSAQGLMKSLKHHQCEKSVKPEITQSMVEINSSVHHYPENLLQDLRSLNNMLLEKANSLGVFLSGGGTHPFQKWKYRKIYPMSRFINLYKQYRYLAKRFTIFGQHVHIGCASGDDAIYLTLALSRYIPHFIALTASSPFYQGIDSGFESSRLSIVSAFPFSGVMPYLKNWQDFSQYYEKMEALNIIKSMKDFYWDIRPKFDTGTVEVRICDTPLTLETAVMISAYIQAISHSLLAKKDKAIREDIYMLYNYNRFQASRYGFSGNFIHPNTKDTCTIQEDMLNTIEKILPYTKTLKSEAFILEIKKRVLKQLNDAYHIRDIYKKTRSLTALMRYQTQLWSESSVSSLSMA